MLSLAYVALLWHHDIPYTLRSPLCTDLIAVIDKLQSVHQPGFFTDGYRWIYPAPCVFLYKFILQFSNHVGNHGNHKVRHAIAMYSLVVFSGLFLLLRGMCAALTRRGLSPRDSWLLMIATTLLSWPIFIALHQGNIEGILWIGVAVAVWAYYRGMWWTSALLIGVVAGFKIYPILLIGLFLAPRKYLQIAVSLITFVVFTTASLSYIGPTLPIAYHNVANGMQSFIDLGFYPGAIDRNYLTFDHSLVSLFRILTTAHPEYMVTMSRYYMPIAATLMTVFFFAVILKMPRLNQLLVIVLAIVLLPPKSYDYTLQMLYIPWAWLALLGVSAAARGAKVPGLMPVMVCMALVCSPEFFIRFQHHNSYGQFKTLCLLVMLWLAARYSFSDEQSHAVRVSPSVEVN